MAVYVEQYGRDPILMITFDKNMTVEDFGHMFEISAQFGQSVDSPKIWRVIDFSNSSVSFADVINAVKYLDHSKAGSFNDPRFMTTFATPHPMARLMSDMLSQKQFGGLQIPVYPGLGEALLSIQEEIYDMYARNG